MATGIPYADEVVNALVGCTHSGMCGCDNCWSRDLHNMRHAAYLAGRDVPKQYAKPFSEIQLLPERIEAPLHWRKPRRIFWCSTSDMFHKDVPFEYIDRMMAVIALTPHHTHLVLTKRVERMVEYWQSRPLWRILPIATEMPHHRDYPSGTVPSEVFKKNLWLGCSCSTQADANRMLPVLLQIPGKHWVSLEPLLEEIDLREFLPDIQIAGVEMETWPDWVVVGCESGAKRRPCSIEAIRSIVRQCQAADVPVWVKQMEIDGWIRHEMKYFPADLQIQETPKNEEKSR